VRPWSQSEMAGRRAKEEPDATQQGGPDREVPRRGDRTTLSPAGFSSRGSSAAEEVDRQKASLKKKRVTEGLSTAFFHQKGAICIKEGEKSHALMMEKGEGGGCHDKKMLVSSISWREETNSKRSIRLVEKRGTLPRAKHLSRHLYETIKASTRKKREDPVRTKECRGRKTPEMQICSTRERGGKVVHAKE